MWGTSGNFVLSMMMDAFECGQVQTTWATSLLTSGGQAASLSVWTLSFTLHPFIMHRGCGLMFGMDLVKDPQTREPHREMAEYIVEK